MIDATAIFGNYVGDAYVPGSWPDLASVIWVPIEDYVAGFNRALEEVETRYVVLGDGGFVAEAGSLVALAREVEAGAGVASPYVRGAGWVPREWHEPICPTCCVMTTAALREIGGLDSRVRAFYWQTLLAAQVLARRLRLVHVPTAVVTPITEANRENAKGALYYDQLADQQRARIALAPAVR